MVGAGKVGRERGKGIQRQGTGAGGRASLLVNLYWKGEVKGLLVYSLLGQEN